MKTHLLGSQLAILVLLCVTVLFFCPAPVGPYPAVHGPVTALQSIRALWRLRWSIATAALSRNLLGCFFSVFASFVIGSSIFLFTESPGQISILRC